MIENYAVKVPISYPFGGMQIFAGVGLMSVVVGGIIRWQAPWINFELNYWLLFYK